MTTRPDSPWTPDTIATLTELWATGMPASQIGARMGLSKSTVVGKANRLKLPARPSPIGRTGPKPPSLTRRILADWQSGIVDLQVIADKHGVPVQTVRLALVRCRILRGRASVATSSAKPPVKASWGGSGTGDAPVAKSAPLHFEYPHDPATLVSGVGGQRGHCQFIPGMPAGRQTLYCGMPAAHGPYCAEHWAVCVSGAVVTPIKAEEISK